MLTPALHVAALATALLPYLADAAPLSFDTALDLAVQRSEFARSARAGVTSATEAARAAGQLPDPTLRVGVDNLPVTGPDRLNTTRESMTMKRVGISQEWLSRDKRAARQAAAESAVYRELSQAQAAVAETRLQTALAYLNVYYAIEALKLTLLVEHHAHEELEAARARLSSSNGSSLEVLALTGACGAAEDESAEMRQQQSASQVALQRWVGVEPDELGPLPVTAVPTEDAFVSAHPSVGRTQYDLDLAIQVAAVAASERAANWTWELSYGQRSGYSDMVSFGVSIPLQVEPAQRQDRETAAKLALIDKAKADLMEATRAATAEYKALASDAQRLQERINRYRSGVIVPAEQRTAAAMAGYQSNQTSLITLFEARHAQIEAQRKLLMLERDLAKTEALLVFKPLITGGAR